MKKKILWAAGVIAIFASYALLFSVSKDSDKQKAAIEIIKKSYAPSTQLLSMRPDFIEAQWTATRYPDRLDGYADVYEVILWMDVVPDDDRKMLKADWLVYAGNTKFLPDNMVAQTLFVSR